MLFDLFKAFDQIESSHNSIEVLGKHPGKALMYNFISMIILDYQSLDKPTKDSRNKTSIVCCYKRITSYSDTVGNI